MSSYGVGGLGMFQFGGLASGLDTKAIVSALVSLERRPIALLEDRKALYKSQKGAFETLDGKLGDLKKSLDALRKATSFLEFTATPDEEGFFAAAASSAAQKGRWEIIVDDLAQAQRNKSAKYADKDVTSFGQGTLTINLDGVPHDIVIDSGNNTLQGIAGAINGYRTPTGQSLDLTATVLDTGGDANRYQLVLSGGEAGSAGAFTLSVDDGDQTFRDFVAEVGVGDGGVTSGRFQTAQNARFRVNGIAIERPGNTVADAIPGVTLTLTRKHTDPANPSTNLTVATSAEEVAKKIQAFVDDYNDVVDFIQGQNKVGENGKAEGVLLGDFTLSTIRSQLRSLAGGAVGTGAHSMLAFVGVEADTAGRLTFTRSEFDEALGEDEQAVKDLFTHGTEGLATRLHTLVEDLTDTVDGLIKNRKDGLDRTMRDADRQIEAQEKRVERFESNLVKRFAAYENLISMYQSQGYSLGSIASLGGN